MTELEREPAGCRVARDLGTTFRGFCTPCGGFRKHKLGCPVGRAAQGGFGFSWHYLNWTPWAPPP